MVASLNLAVGLVEWKVSQVQKTCCSAVNSTSHTHEYHSSSTHVLKSALCGSILMVCSLCGSAVQAAPFFSQDRFVSAVGNTFSSKLACSSFEQILHSGARLATNIGLSSAALDENRVFIAANAANAANVAQDNLQNGPSSFSDAAIHALSQNQEKLGAKDSHSADTVAVQSSNSADNPTVKSNSAKSSSTSDKSAVTNAEQKAVANDATNASDNATLSASSSSVSSTASSSTSSIASSSAVSTALSSATSSAANNSTNNASTEQSPETFGSDGIEQEGTEQLGSNQGKVDAASLSNNAGDATTQLSQVKNPSLVLEGAGQNKFGNVRQSSATGGLQNGLNTPTGILQWMLSTIGVLAFIFFLAYIFRKSRFVQRAVGTMQVEGQIALGPKERLVRVKAGDRTLLLGVTSNSVNLILDISEQLHLDNETKADNNDKVGDDFSSAYRSAQAAYARKNYEEMLAHCSQIAASAAAKAVVNILSSKSQNSESNQIDERVSQGFYGPTNDDQQVQDVAGTSLERSSLSTSTDSGVVNTASVSSGSQYSENSRKVSKTDGAYGQDALQTREYLQNNDNQFSSEGKTTDLSDERQRLSNQDKLKGSAQSVMASSDSSTITTSRQGSHDVAAAVYEPKKFQAIVEPHANEAHNIANHFSSEHTIVRASKSTQFASTHFNVPPDNQVLHARAKRSKYNTRALELEVEPQSRTRPRSEQIDNSGKHQTKNSGENARFGAYLDSAFDELSKSHPALSQEGSIGAAASFMENTQPWVAEDDLAQAVEEQRKKHKR